MREGRTPRSARRERQRSARRGGKPKTTAWRARPRNGGRADRPRTSRLRRRPRSVWRERQRSARRGGKPKTSGWGARPKNGGRGGSSTSGPSARRRLASFARPSSIVITGKRSFRVRRLKSRSGHSWRPSSDGRAGRMSTHGHNVRASSVAIAGGATMNTPWARRSDGSSRTRVHSQRDGRPRSSVPRVRRRNVSSRSRRSGAPVSNPSVRLR